MLIMAGIKHIDRLNIKDHFQRCEMKDQSHIVNTYQYCDDLIVSKIDAEKNHLNRIDMTIFIQKCY